ncbi:hypothetical protein [Methanobrevibacter sp. V14]|nr:hypothetical protein [Methanobrevibacter sp. V14]
MNIGIKVDLIYPKNDFYLQWDYIYWWQMKFNINKSVSDAICELVTVEV